ncbi:hypothetical protein [Mycolicibacterium porcinum]
MVRDGDDDLVGFLDAVDSAVPPELADEYYLCCEGPKPSSLLYAQDLIWMRGLLVTQAAELEAGLRELLTLATKALAKCARTAQVKLTPPSRLTGPGAVRNELQRLLNIASTYGLISPADVARLRLDEVQTACAIRNQAAHAGIRTEYAYYGGQWQPIWSWFGDEATAEASDLAERLAVLKDATTIVAHAYWPLHALGDGGLHTQPRESD